MEAKKKQTKQSNQLPKKSKPYPISGCRIGIGSKNLKPSKNSEQKNELTSQDESSQPETNLKK